MSLYRLLLRSLHQQRRHFTSATQILSFSLTHHLLPNTPYPSITPTQHQAHRYFAFSSAEEAAAERRRRKRRLRIEPPLHALRPQYPSGTQNSGPPRPNLPDTTSSLVGPRLNLHNRVQSLIRASDLDAAALVARRSVFSNIRPTVFTCNAIIAAMYRAKRYDDAIVLFQYFFNQSNIIPNVVSYNNLINSHCDKSEVDTALGVYRQILANAPFSPSPVSYCHLTKGLIESGRIGEAMDLLREMLNKGHGADSRVYNNLISGFLELGNLEKANELFAELTERCTVYDGVVNATYMDWFFRQGRDKEAMESYKSLMDRNFRMVPATCNVLLQTLLKHGKKTEAWALFEQMLDNHTTPSFQALNSETFNIMVNECFKLGKFAEAIDTFKKVGTKVGSKPFIMDVAGYSNIIVKFCEHGMLTEAERFYTELYSKSLSPDATSYRSLIDAYLKMERIDDALQMLNKMVEAKLRVVVGFGTRVFGVLIENGKAVDTASILMKMGEQDPKPDPLFYDVLVKGLCKEDAFDMARDVLDHAVKQNVGVTPALEEFVREAFGKVGRGQDIQTILDANKWGLPRPPRMGGHPQSRPLQFQGQQPFGAPQMTGQTPSAYPQMAEQGHSGPQPMTGQGQFGDHQMPGQLQSAPLPPRMAAQPPPGIHQMTGQRQFIPSQFAGQHPSGPGAPQMASSWSPQMGGQQPSIPSQMPLHQAPRASQMEGQRSLWSPQIVRQQPPSWSSKMVGQPPSVTSQMAGNQKLWSSQLAGQQPSWSPQLDGQQPLGNPPMEAQHPYGPASVVGQQMEPSQMSGQQQQETIDWQDSRQQVAA